MDFSYSKVAGVTKADIKILQEACQMVEEAKKCVDLIKQHYKFEMNQAELEVWCEDGGNYFEYVTYSGYWRYEGLMGEKYQIECKKDVIYTYLMADYMLQNYSEWLTKEEKEQYPQMAKAARYFKAFILRIKESDKQM